MQNKTTGYSGKSLPDKLGIKTGFHVILLNEPEGYGQILAPLPANVSLAKSGAAEVIQYFTTSKQQLEKYFPELKAHMFPRSSLWISWPKGSSGVDADLNENIIREIGLKNGLVDVKVIAVDETWSGLKFVFRLRDRAINEKE